MSLSSTSIRFRANGGETRIIGNQTVKSPGAGDLYDRVVKYSNGTGQSKAQKIASYQLSLAAGAQTTIDLTAIPAANSMTGVAFGFTAIKAMVAENSNVEQEVDVVTVTGTPAGGTLTITIGGQTTAGIVYNAAASVVKTAIELLSTVGSGKSTVTGSAGGPWTISLASSLGLLTTTASGAGLTGGSTPAAAAVRKPSNLEVGDDSTGTNVWSAIFKGTNARFVLQPGETEGRGTKTTGGYTVDSSHKNLLITNAGGVAATGILLLVGEGS